MLGREMKGRKMNRTALFVAVFFVSASFGNVIWGYDSLRYHTALSGNMHHPPDQIMRMVEQIGEYGGDLESLYEYLEWLTVNPVNINTASIEQLESLPMMTPFMVASIIDYRRDYGLISSMAELSLIDGFDEQLVMDLTPFIIIGGISDVNLHRPKTSKLFKQKLVIRTKSVFARKEEELYGIPLSIYTKYRITFNDKYSAGFTFETDRGERGFPDFYSMYLFAKDIPISYDSKVKISSLAVGDYSMRFGQGLVLWNGFSMSGLSEPSAAYRKQHGITPYTSSDENAYFHGAGITIVTDNPQIELSAAYSHNLLDARIENDGFVTLPEDGLHDSEGLENAENNLAEDVIGMNVCWRNDFLKIGTTLAFYSYALDDARRKSYYNEHLRYDGWWGNASVDFLLSLRGFRIFGELALDRRGTFAGIAGAVFPLWEDAECSLLYRYYDPYYIATHSGAYNVSSCNNEHGITVSFKWRPMRSLAVYSEAVYTRFPYHRYGVRGESDKVSASAICEWGISYSSKFSFKTSFSWDTGKQICVEKLRAEYFYSTDFGMQSVTRAECCISGMDQITIGGLVYNELIYASPFDKFKGSVRATLFSAMDWDSRIYCYERDLPGSFSVPAYYGRGISIYAMLTYKPYRWLNVSIKCSGTIYTDDIKDKVKLNFQATLPF